MRSWDKPSIPSLPGRGLVPEVYDDATGELAPSLSPERAASGRAALYVCGITPYDATHLGHAATYLAFDQLVRAWIDADLEVTVAQCVTDVDDPLLERAQATGVDWRELADSQIELYRGDMTALRIVPPDYYRGVVETVPQIVAAVEHLWQAGAAYQVSVEGLDGPGDFYADLAADPRAGTLCRLDCPTMAGLFAQRGGDPDRVGKRGPLDPLLWRQARPGEPAWDGGRLGPGRPGWHIECAVIAADGLGVPFDVQAGGADLIYPHHEMSTSHLRLLRAVEAPIGVQLHAGLISYRGAKMSKSLGNLVFVSQLVAGGVDPMAIRLALLAGHYRDEREWTDQLLVEAERRLEAWRAAICHSPEAASSAASCTASGTVAAMRRALAHDLDTPAAIRAVDAWVAGDGAGSIAADEVAGDGKTGGAGTGDAVEKGGAAELERAIDALLGVALR